MSQRGIAIVISAASGTGKTSLCQKLAGSMPGITSSISHTTRDPRGSEENGVDYHFVAGAEFTRMAKQGEFVEWAKIFDNRYGTAWAGLEQQLERGEDVLLDIDVQGGTQIREKLSQTLLIFLLPPSMKELRRRLTSRGTESAEHVERRLQEAREEISSCHIYDYLVVNDDLEQAERDVRAIISATRLRLGRPDALVRKLMDSSD